MSTISEQVLQDFASGLESARTRCGELRAAVAGAQAELERVRAETARQMEALRQQVADALDAAREAQSLAVQEITGSADLARQLAERLAQSGAEARALVGQVDTNVDDWLQQVVGDSSAFADAVAAANASADDNGETARASWAQAAEDCTARLEEASSTLATDLQGLAGEADTAFTQARERMDGALQRDAAERGALTREELDASATRLAEESRGHAQAHQDEATAGVEEHREGWTTRFSELASNAREFSGEVAAAGENVLGIARAMTEGADTVTDAMQATNVGLRTVVGIFDNMRSIMDDIISFA
ncbi:MAG: hypothetical protein IT479_06780 [Xanthomonadales bacterium]|nr:hypothetical protein [Xanthomonadales bacterium]MCC6592965.1 hypothetical protein [Xanthomonadales bacterium]MCE7930606.1 hypothetical protein [Xanthomonadales bacterium PRO6]